jgi:hypothetical protein
MLEVCFSVAVEEEKERKASGILWAEDCGIMAGRNRRGGARPTWIDHKIYFEHNSNRCCIGANGASI